MKRLCIATMEPPKWFITAELFGWYSIPSEGIYSINSKGFHIIGRGYDKSSLVGKIMFIQGQLESRYVKFEEY